MFVNEDLKTVFGTSRSYENTLAYIVLEALLVASLVYMFSTIIRLPVADSIASINHDITLSKDAYISDAGITLAKGTIRR